MSSLRKIDKVKLERYLDMGSGYICDFSNNTFGEFVLESTGVDIYTPEYEEYGTSKANRLRLFWQKESDYLVAKLLEDLIEYWEEQKAQRKANRFSWEESSNDTQDDVLLEQCQQIVARLKEGTPVENIDALKPNNQDKSFHVLADSIKESIRRDQPEEALDRLHTFVVKYLRELCVRHGVKYDKNTTLNALMGAYIKALKEKSLIESEMTEKILKYSINILEAFNSVRNDKSLAHDNPILNRDESILIFNNIANSIKFIEAFESKLAKKQSVKIDEVNVRDIQFPNDNSDLSLEKHKT